MAAGSADPGVAAGFTLSAALIAEWGIASSTRCACDACGDKASGFEQAPNGRTVKNSGSRGPPFVLDGSGRGRGEESNRSEKLGETNNFWKARRYLF